MRETIACSLTAKAYRSAKQRKRRCPLDIYGLSPLRGASRLTQTKLKGSAFADPFSLVRERGLEPPRLAAQPPQGCVATITPLARKLLTMYGGL